MFHLFSSDSIDWAAKMFLAHSVIIFLMLMNFVSLSIPYAGDFKPFFLLMAIYYWAIYRPTLVPIAYVFALGIVVDLQSGLPVGLSAMLLVICKAIVQRQRAFLMGQPYVTVWIGFALMSLMQAFFMWLVVSLQAWTFMPIIPITVAAGFSIVIFPLISLILLGVHRLLPLQVGQYVR
jgi:rod shape-determining protein MreD